MNKMVIVLKHEFRQKIRSKAFIILTCIAPLLMAALIAVPIFITLANQGNDKQIVIIDSTGRLGKYFIADSGKRAALFAPGSSQSSRPSFGGSIHIRLMTYGTEHTADSLKALLLQKSISGYLSIPPNAISDSLSIASLRMTNANDFSVEGFLSSHYKDALFAERLKAGGIDPSFVQHAREGGEINTLKVTEEAEMSDNGIGFAAGYITGLFLYISMILYGTLIMQSVIEEKNSRVIELLTSSVKPIDILIGKVLGVGLAGLLQVTVWALMFASVSFFALPALLASLGAGASQVISPSSFIYFVLYFIFGYLMYATLYAGAGATVEQASDAQQISMPITMLIVLPLLMMTSVIQSPSSTSSVILSLIPLFSPILMLGRIFSEPPPMWQILLSFVLMGSTFFGVLWVSGKVYRTGILMYGKKYSLREVFKWLKYS
ncbi:MAG: ABC transporter permease [Bacteroidota bacterium]|nr:ABC transporter permease [Bacteroidota bacterium]MDP4236336.1 ABC transporter permease [Bacteroidota bacterium]